MANQLPTMSSTTNRLLLPSIDFEKIPIQDMRPPLTSKQTISFLQLPRELRDPIYSELLASGDVAILRLNKLINEEASQLLPKHATFRINLGYINGTNWSELGSASVTPNVQYVDLRIKVSSDALPFDISVISGLLDRHVIRECCVVTLDYGKEACPSQPIYKALYKHLARLCGFKKVVCKIEIERYEYADLEAEMSLRTFHEVFHYDTHLLRYHVCGYTVLFSYLEPSMGPPTLDYSVEGHCVEFHPLEPVDESW